MFGLTKREQRWKAEQRAAELLVGLASVVVKAAADIRVAEANTTKDTELARLKVEVEKLRKGATHEQA